MQVTEPGGQDAGHLAAAAGRREAWSGLAVAALVSGILPTIPLALVLGPLALARIRRTGERGRGLAIAGLALAGTWTVAAAVTAAGVIIAQRHQARPVPVSLPAVFSLRTGQCFNSGRNGISGLTVVACGQPHDGEVYATYRVAGRPWPGNAALHGEASQGCMSGLAGYLNPQLATTTLAESYIYPDAGAWAAGERTVVCEIRSTAGKLTGSVRASDG